MGRLFVAGGSLIQRLAATLPVIDFGSGTNPVLTGHVNVAFPLTGATVSGSVQIKDDQYTYSFSPTSTPQLTAPNNTIALLSSSSKTTTKPPRCQGWVVTRTIPGLAWGTLKSSAHGALDFVLSGHP